MDNVVVATWLLTALVGGYMLSIAQRRGGVATGDAVPRTHFPLWLLFLHPTLAITGVLVWLVYVWGDHVAFAWIGFSVFVLTAIGGELLFMRWFRDHRHRRELRATESRVGEPVMPEQDIPAPVVVVHGTLATLTIVFALLAALGIGASR